MASVLQQQQLQQQQQQLLNQNQQQQTVSTTEVAGGEFTETRSVQLEWKITGLKQLFESTKGDNKSKCIKSALFDSSRWQVYLYMNSGVEQYLSLYLSCEPTATEREKGLEAEKALWPLGTKNAPAGSASNRNSVVGSSKSATAGKGSWRREGKYKFSFEARSLDGKLTFKTMEAENHVFNESQKNWGYSTFIKRSDAFYSNPSVRLSDGMQIVCTIVSSATNPTPAELPRLLIPKDLVASYASLFDDPDYSDVCFIIRSEPQEDGRRRKKISERRIYAAKKILAGRSEYFATMFNSGFYESTAVPPSPVAATSSTDTPLPLSQSQSHSRASSNNSDSDDSDSNDEWDEDDDSDLDEEEEELDAYEEAELSDTASTHATYYAASTSSRQVPSSAGASDDEKDKADEEEIDSPTLVSVSVEGVQGDDSLILEAVSNASISLAEKRRTVESDSFVDAVGDFTTRRLANKKKVKKPTKIGARATDRRPRAEVVVTDAAYTSFRALIYYLYTDSITFAPLSSTYAVAKEAAQVTNSPFPFANRRAYLKQKNSDLQLPQPCSSKAIYRLADKIGLPELKEKASEFIFKNLTAQNIVFEVFGSFSLRFEEVKRVQIAFLLERWNEVRSSSSMRRVFEQIRSGSHPGFEDVFLAILNNLEYKPELDRLLKNEADALRAQRDRGGNNKPLQARCNTKVARFIGSINKLTTQQATTNRWTRYKGYCNEVEIPYFPLMGDIVALSIYWLADGDLYTGRSYDSNISALNGLRNVTCQLWKNLPGCENVALKLTADAGLNELGSVTRACALDKRNAKNGKMKTRLVEKRVKVKKADKVEGEKIGNLEMEKDDRDSRKRGREEISENQASLISSSLTKPSIKEQPRSPSNSSTTSSTISEASRSPQSTFNSKISSSTSNLKSQPQTSNPQLVLPLPSPSSLSYKELSNFLYFLSPIYIPLAPILYNEIGINSRLSLCHLLTTMRATNRLDLLSNLNLSEGDHHLFRKLLGSLVKVVRQENEKKS